jgi:ankyrin repeat protein
MDYREQEVRKAHIDSCNWILEHPYYTEWITKRRGLLGIKGKPGSGKSTLMKRIFRLLGEKTDPNCVQLAFFFHRRGTSLQHTRIGMFRGLLYQLLNQVPSAGQGFYSLCERKKRWQGDSGKDRNWRLEELQEAFSSALLAAAKDHSVRIFIDALDEAGEDAAREVVSYLYDVYDKLSMLDATVAVCFSCRHFPILTVSNGFEICLEHNNQKDIERYALTELKRAVGERGSFFDTLQADIVSRASGVFMWVALAVPLVARQYNNGKPLDAIRQTLQAVPSELEEVYKHILTKVVERDDRSQTLHLMQWIYLAERPLSVTEIRFAMASDDSFINQAQYSCQESKDFVEDNARMKKLIISLTGGLAEVKYHSQSDYGRQDTVQFIHQSVNDFLSKDKFRCLELDKTEDLIGQGHYRLSRSCINYLQLGEVRHAINALDDSEDYAYQIKARLIVDVPFIEYAAKSWFVHAEKAESYGISQQDLLCRLKWPSDEFFLRWIKVSNVINRYDRRYLGRGANLLHIAAASNLLTTALSLLENGANLESEDERGNRPVHYAARWGHDRMVNILLDAKAEIEAANKNGETALERAAGAGHEAVVSLLLGGEGGDGDINRRLNRPLLAAAEGGRERTVWLLLERGADVNAQGGHFGSALQATAYNGHEAVVRILLEQGADVNAQGGVYGNALQAAAYYSHEAVVRVLLEQGADANAQGGKYGNALQAAAYNGKEVVVRVLLEKGAEVNAQGGHYGNALQAAARSGHEAVVGFP